MRSVPSSDGLSLAVHHLSAAAPAGADPSAAPAGADPSAAPAAPALFAHATGFHGRIWGPVARRLPELDSWAPDFRAHGDSTAPEGLPLSWEGFADDVLATVDALGLVQPVGVGHSKGGAALLLAERRRPGTFRALWCYEPVVFPPDVLTSENPDATDEPDPSELSTNPLAAGALRRRETFASVEAAVSSYGSKPPMEVFDPEALDAYVRFGFAEQPDGSIRLKCRPADEARVYLMGARHHAWDALPGIACPVAIVRGAVEPFGPSQVADAIAARLPDGHLEVYPQLGHFGPMQDPDLIATSIRDFLEAVPG